MQNIEEQERNKRLAQKRNLTKRTGKTPFEPEKARSSGKRR